MTASFVQHAVYVTAGFILKVMFTKVLAIRYRLANGIYAWPEDETGLKFLMPVLKIAFIAIPAKSVEEAHDTIARFGALERNNVENETFFIFAMWAWIYQDSAIGLHATCLAYAALGFRVIHTILLLNKIEPFRTISYLPCMVITFYFAIRALALAPPM